jgi:hypothetical protein
MGKKILSVLVLLSGVNAFAGGVPMPEPSAFPELVLTLAGAGALVWLALRWHRRRGSSLPGSTNLTDSSAAMPQGSASLPGKLTDISSRPTVS